MKRFFFSVVMFSLASASCQVTPRNFDANPSIETIKANSQLISSSPNPNDIDQIIIKVAEKGQIVLQHSGKEENLDTTSSVNKFQVRIAEILEKREDKTVIVRASRSIEYEQIQRVIDALRQAKASPVGVQIED